MFDLIDQLEELCDDQRERVAKLFSEIRNAVPRPMTLVFAEADVGGIRTCRTKAGVTDINQLLDELQGAQ